MTALSGRELTMNWNLGSGTDTKPGYTNFDLRPLDGVTDVVCDVTKDLPEDFKGKVENIIAFEILEHFELGKAKAVLDYWISFLKTGGKLHLRVPDILEVVRQRQRGDLSWEEFNRYLYGAQQYDTDYHKSAYTGQDFVDLLGKLGMEVEQLQYVPGTRMLYVTAVKNETD